MGHIMGIMGITGITVLLVDALNLIRRVYAAQPGEDGPERAHHALQAGVQSLHRALRECQPTHAVCIFDGQGPSWRHQLYKGYKAGRPPMPEALHVSKLYFPHILIRCFLHLSSIAFSYEVAFKRVKNIHEII